MVSKMFDSAQSLKILLTSQLFKLEASKKVKAILDTKEKL